MGIIICLEGSWLEMGVRMGQDLIFALEVWVERYGLRDIWNRLVDDSLLTRGGGSGFMTVCVLRRIVGDPLLPLFHRI